MSSRKSRQHPEVLMEDVIEAIAATERDYGVHLHYVIRRPARASSRPNVRIILFARKLGLGDEVRTELKEDLAFPTSDGLSFVSTLFYLVNLVGRTLEERRQLEAQTALPFALDR